MFFKLNLNQKQNLLLVIFYIKYIFKFQRFNFYYIQKKKFLHFYVSYIYYFYF